MGELTAPNRGAFRTAGDLDDVVADHAIANHDEMFVHGPSSSATRVGSVCSS